MRPEEGSRLYVGRDLVLDSAQQDRPLNYFVYPYAEVAGRAWKGPVEKRFSYRKP